MSTAWHTGTSANGFKIAVIDRRELHEGIARASASAFRNGVPGVRLDGLAALDTSNRLVLVDRSQSRREGLKVRLAEERRVAKRLRALAAGEGDDGVANEYRDDAREHTLLAKNLEAELVQMETSQREARLPDLFSGEVEYLLMAVRSLLDPSGTVGRDEAEALDKVLDDLQLREVGDDRIEFSFNWLIPADGTVARFGPITGTIQRRGRVLTPAERSQLEGGGRDRRDRRVLVHQLEKAGLSYDIARAVSVSPFAQLGEALLGGDPEWPGVPDGFDHHEFNEFLREKYRALPSWAKGVYCQTNPKRQALADAVAAFGGKARIDQLRVVTRVLGIKDTDLHPLTLPRVKPNTLIWEPSVSRVGIWSATTMADESYAESRWCSNCDASATAVVRVPEVPGSILCRECCTSPFDPSRVFPSVYVDLALPETEIPADALIKAKSLPIGTVKKGRASWLEKVRSEIVEVPVVERLGSDLDGK